MEKSGSGLFLLVISRVCFVYSLIGINLLFSVVFNFFNPFDFFTQILIVVLSLESE